MENDAILHFFNSSFFHAKSVDKVLDMSVIISLYLLSYRQ